LQNEGVDIIVAVTHLGIDESSEETSYDVADAVEGIDLIIDGHSHSLYENGLVVGNTLIASAGQYEGYLGVVTVSFDGDNNVTAIEASVISAADAIEAYEPHEEVVALIEEIRAAQGLVLDVAITEFAYSLSSARDPGVRTQEMPLGNLVADAMLFGSGADIALANGGGLRADINEGTVTIGDVIAVLPFGNYGVTKYITAADLKVLLENGVAGAPAAVGKFPQISGFTFAYNPDNEPGDRVVSIAVNGVDVDMADTTAKYLLVTNDFMAAGGDDYTTLANFPVENEFGALDEMLRDYLLSNPDKSYAEAEGRITVVTGEYVAPPVAETAAEAEEAADETEPETKPAAAESVSGQTGVVANAAAVYVRTGHHPSYDVVTALTRGTVVQVHDLNSQWYQITCGDVEGWIYMGYIELR
jgi:5'-nucleotidase